jgi:hypothetical protein
LARTSISTQPGGNPTSQKSGVEMTVKIYAATALSSSVSRRRSSLHDGGDESGDDGFKIFV